MFLCFPQVSYNSLKHLSVDFNDYSEVFKLCLVAVNKLRHSTLTPTIPLQYLYKINYNRIHTYDTLTYH